MRVLHQRQSHTGICWVTNLPFPRLRILGSFRPSATWFRLALAILLCQQELCSLHRRREIIIRLRIVASFSWVRRCHTEPRRSTVPVFASPKSKKTSENFGRNFRPPHQKCFHSRRGELQAKNASRRLSAGAGKKPPKRRKVGTFQAVIEGDSDGMVPCHGPISC